MPSREEIEDFKARIKLRKAKQAFNRLLARIAGAIFLLAAIFSGLFGYASGAIILLVLALLFVPRMYG